MKRNVFLMLVAVVSVLFGLGLLFGPDFVAKIYGTSLNPGGVATARLYGAALIGFAVIYWLIREAADSATLTGVFRGGLVYSLIGLVLSIWFTTTGVWGPVGWSGVAIFLLFGAGFGYYASGKR